MDSQTTSGAMMNESLFCGRPGRSPYALASDWARGGRRCRNLLHVDGRRIIMTYQGRVAIARACQFWGLGDGDEVLVPAYNCGSEADAVLWSGAKVVLYRVDSHAVIDEEDIRRRVTGRTRALYVTHYFGWPQRLRGLAMWCQDRGIRLLEDCALSLFSIGPEGYLGSIGAAAIFNFPKWFPTPDGGALALPESECEQDTVLAPPGWRPVVVSTLPLLKSYIMRTAERLGVYPVARRLLGRSWLRGGDADETGDYPDMPHSYYFDGRTVGWAPSKPTMGMLSHVVREDFVASRRRNYQHLYRALRNVAGIQPLFDDLPEGVCPLALPLLVSNRRRWVKELDARGIAAIPWWAGYHRRLSWSEFEEARFLKDHVLALPVHQDLDVRHMTYIAEVAQWVAEAIARQP